MSIGKNDSFSTVTTESGNNGIMFKNYHFMLRRTNKNGNKIRFCTYKLCNASTTTHEYSVLKTASIKSYGSEKNQQWSEMNKKQLNNAQHVLKESHRWLVKKF